MDRPIATLFMLMSVDGKINTGSTDELDVDRDFPRIPGVREGLMLLHEYYKGFVMDAEIFMDIECDPRQAVTEHIAKKHGFRFSGKRDGCDVYKLEE